ncbi:hypothetical protein FVQ98_17485 [Ottowia sp. GY511]|uniref:DUF4148 domain-containing protein n=1 Tax=Ottowia flava TaxID=2675430 RepID=A0ABW4KVX5_9BURK|nr:hypothetical protein [Ottowia sp. GY511]TXK23361.1 hypothetical protein FVQ98_17485 [Ottowia sp. GY511]
MTTAKTTLLRALSCSVAVLGLSLAMAAPAQAKGKGKAHGVQLKRAPVTTYANGLDATQRQRSEEARLRRECKGRPNAGACLGYTR